MNKNASKEILIFLMYYQRVFMLERTHRKNINQFDGN